MAVEIRQGAGIQIQTKEAKPLRHYELVVDGHPRGIYFRGSGKIKWNVPTRKLPRATIKKAIRLCRDVDDGRI